MATMAVDKELLTLERQYWQAVKDRDVETAMLLTDDHCIVAGAHGVVRLERRSLADMMKETSYTLRHFEIMSDAHVRPVGKDVAILAYRVREELTVDGKPMKLDASDTSVWTRRNGQWVCSLHMEALAGDPYGRDRRVAARM